MMNKDNAKEYIKFLQALLDGEEIEYLDFSYSGKEKWVSVDSLCFVNPSRYRIKPKPKYRPFTYDEFFDLVLSKRIFFKKGDEIYLCESFSLDGIRISGILHSFSSVFLEFKLVFEDKTEHLCGVKIEERHDKIQLKV